MRPNRSLAVVTFFATDQAFAQSADIGALEEVVVTAQRREQLNAAANHWTQPGDRFLRECA
jgi:hypothetical protein